MIKYTFYFETCIIVWIISADDCKCYLSYAFMTKNTVSHLQKILVMQSGDPIDTVSINK